MRVSRHQIFRTNFVHIFDACYAFLPFWACYILCKLI